MVITASTPVGTLPMPAPLPMVRTAAFATVSVAFALIAHSTTSHTLPPIWMIALSVVVVAATAHPMASLEHRLPSLVAGLIATQLILHAVFQLQATGRANATAAGWLCCGTDQSPAATPATHSAGTFGRAALVQLGVHILAALVIAAALRLRERSTWTLARAAALRSGAMVRHLVAALISILGGMLPVETGLLARRAQPERSTPASMRPVLLDARAPRRGPPARPAAGRTLSFA